MTTQARRPLPCRRIIALAKHGLSITEIAVSLGTTRQSLVARARFDSDLKATIEFAKDAALAYWERKARAAVVRSSREFFDKQIGSVNKRTRRKWRKRAREARRDGVVLVNELARRFPREYGRHVAQDVAPAVVERVITRLTN